MSKRLTLDNILEWFLILFVTGAIILVGNYINCGAGILETLPGMLILIVISTIGLALAKLIPFNIPAMCYISVIGILVAIPASPLSNYVVTATKNIQVLSICTAVLAYTGISIGKSWAEFKQIGWRGIVVTLLVMFGTFFASALCAELLLRAQGITG